MIEILGQTYDFSTTLLMLMFSLHNFLCYWVNVISKWSKCFKMQLSTVEACMPKKIKIVTSLLVSKYISM